MSELLTAEELKALESTEDSELDDSGESTCDTCQRLTCQAQLAKDIKYFREVEIPEAERKLIEGVNELFGVCPHDCLPEDCTGCHRYSDKKFCPIIKLQQLKQKRGI